MKIRSQLEVQNCLDQEISRRKREMITLNFLISNGRSHEKVVLMRSASILMYAHWEGFIKYSSLVYLQYVSRQNIPLKLLKNNFVALACRSEIMAAAPTKKVGVHTGIFDFFTANLEHAVPLSIENAIDTESNLSSKVLKDIILTLGLDYSSIWEIKSAWIDSIMLYNRNKVAHGEVMEIDADTYIEIRDNVIQSLDEFKREIENAVTLKSYLKPI